MQEQPVSSVFAFTPRFQQMLGCIRTYCAPNVHMGSYGGTSLKTLKLYSNAEWISALVKDRQPSRGFEQPPETLNTHRGRRACPSLGIVGMHTSATHPTPTPRAQQDRPREIAGESTDIVKIYTSGGKRRVTGGPGLKATQAYPAEFGQAVGEAFMRNIPSGCPKLATRSFSPQNIDLSDAMDSDPWEDACLPEVLSYLSA